MEPEGEPLFHHLSGHGPGTPVCGSPAAAARQAIGRPSTAANANAMRMRQNPDRWGTRR